MHPLYTCMLQAFSRLLPICFSPQSAFSCNFNLVMKKQVLLTLTGIAALALFLVLPVNRQWLQTRIFPYWAGTKYQVNHMDKEERMKRRFLNEYILSRQIADSFEVKGIKNEVLVLIPPTSYFKKMGIAYHVPEPAIFYYYTGLKTTWANSKQASKANWYVRAVNGKLVMDSVKNNQDLSDSIKAFIQLGYSL